MRKKTKLAKSIMAFAMAAAVAVSATGCGAKNESNAKTQADEEDSSLVEKSIPFQTEAETRKERPKPTRTEHKKSSKTDAQTESLFGRDFQNRTKSGSGGSKKRSSSKKAQTIQSDGEQMRFDESNTDVIKCKV